MPGAGRNISSPEVVLALNDLSRRLTLGQAQISVRSFEQVDWNDASLGCPQPGMMYAQVITPGFRVTLEANGKTYDYHGANNRVILCEKSLGLPRSATDTSK